MIEFLAQLLGVLLTILATLITHLLYQIDCVILNAVLHVHLLPDLLLLPLLVPNAPLLAMLPRLLVLHWIIIMIRVTARNSPLGFRAVSLMDQAEAQELVQRLNLAVQGKRSKPREENLIIRNGVIKKLEGNELNFITQETKIITDFNPPQWEEERNNRNAELRQRDNYQPTQQTNFQQISTQQQAQGNPAPALRKSSSFIEQFQPQDRDELDLKDDYCRIWYQKIALQSHVFNLQHQNQRKDQLISQLRQQLQSKSQPHFTINPNPHTHNKSVSMHPTFNIQNPQPAQSPSQNSSHWASVHPGRNFNLNRNF